jgi:hypothetical protein
MKITLFTSNQPRHLKLIQKLSKISSELYVISEVTTVFPGIKSDFYSNYPNLCGGLKCPACGFVQYVH